jgi:hypothetical protein
MPPHYTSQCPRGHFEADLHTYTMNIFTRNTLQTAVAAARVRGAFHFSPLKLPKLSLAVACRFVCGNEALAAAATAVQGSECLCWYV